MKKLKLTAMDLGISGILNREELKIILGGYGSSGGGGGYGGGGPERCSNDRFCSMYMARDGGCKTMATGQCRCVRYTQQGAVESVPDPYCLL